MPSTKPLLISFSGIDGAGKSTQISALAGELARSGKRVRCLAFWDDVVVLRSFREFMSHRILGGDSGAGSPERPIRRRDKDVRSPALTLMRSLFSLLDALHLAWITARLHRGVEQVVIFDRYLYDELANLPLQRKAVRMYATALLKLAPGPDHPYLLDADPGEARVRKPEYPLEFLRRNRANYLALARLAGNLTILEPLPAAELKDRIWQAVALDLLGSELELKPGTRTDAQAASAAAYAPGRHGRGGAAEQPAETRS